MAEELIRLTREAKRTLMTRIGALPEAVYRVEITRVRAKLTRDQQSFYFAAIVTPFAAMAMEHDAELSHAVAMEVAHKRLKEEFLAKPVVGPGGELIETHVPSLMELDTKQMSQFIEQCIAFLAKRWDVVVVSPDECAPEKRGRLVA